ncbi:MAG TPA: ABC transporter permease [Bryobacteraceae bacterium]|nr:ABC transporter permease [Bryobacteraceae bacterium]
MRRWNVWLRRPRWEQRMDAELRFHFDSQIEDYIKQGLNRQEAERQARLDFGGLELAKDECRDEQPLAWLDHFLRDLRYAGRSLRRNPGFAAAVALTLALGVGANTAVFAVIYFVLLRPLPYTEPDQIHSIQVVLPERRAQIASLPPTVQAFLEWRRAQTAFSSITALRPWECNLLGGGEPERIGAARVATNFFRFLGVPMALGRDFSREEEQLGKERVVIISDGLWRRRFGSDPAVLGRKISVNGDPHTVVGVAPPSLLVPTGTVLHPQLSFAQRVDLWKPIAPTTNELQSESWNHGVLVRLRPGTRIEDGSRQLEAILNEMIRALVPGITTRLEVQAVPIREVYSGDVRVRLLLILAASGVLLLVACANIANLTLARVAGRLNEFATRFALGASRTRIIVQIWVETWVLALLGGLFGIGFAVFGEQFLSAQAPPEIQLLMSSQIGIPGLFFALALSLFTGFACGALPAWWSFRMDSAQRLRERTHSTTGSAHESRIRHVLVGFQIALATALLASASLLLHSFVKLIAVDRGYQIERVLAVDLTLAGTRQDPARFYGRVVECTRSLPGVLAAGVISGLPAAAGSTGPSQTIFHASDTDFESLVLKRPVAAIRSVTPGYFSASGSVLKAGRFLHDLENTPVALVSESLARRLWPRESLSAVVGRTIRQGSVTGDQIAMVGIVQDVLPGAVDRPLPPLIYRPFSQSHSVTGTLLLRTSEQPSRLARAARAEIWKVNPNVPISSVRTMREVVSVSVAQRRFQMMLISVFALVALALGAIGVYGVVSYNVNRRTREIGLRLALGAMRRELLAWLIVRGMRPVLAGLSTGLIISLALARSLRSLLYGIEPADPLAFAGVVASLLLASGLACYLPARRASRLDPMRALRHD